MNELRPLYLLIMTIGLLIIIQGLYWLKTGKARKNWWGLRKTTKEENPDEFWALVRLEVGIGLVVFVISAILFLLSWV